MRIVVTAVVAAVLGAFAAVGIYAASQPTNTQVQAPLVNYGSQP